MPGLKLTNYSPDASWLCRSSGSGENRKPLRTVATRMGSSCPGLHATRSGGLPGTFCRGNLGSCVGRKWECAGRKPWLTRRIQPGPDLWGGQVDLDDRNPRPANVPVLETNRYPAKCVRGSGRADDHSDNAYRLFIDGREIGQGVTWDSLREYDLSRILGPGPHILAVECFNEYLRAGLVAGLRIQLQDGRRIDVPTDGSWKIVPNDQKKWTTNAPRASKNCCRRL
jgi:hypothetical protein